MLICPTIKQHSNPFIKKWPLKCIRTGIVAIQMQPIIFKNWPGVMTCSNRKKNGNNIIDAGNIVLIRVTQIKTEVGHLEMPKKMERRFHMNESKDPLSKLGDHVIVAAEISNKWSEQ